MIIFHSFQAFTPLSGAEWERLVQAVSSYEPDEYEEPWGADDDEYPYWQWIAQKNHYYVNDYNGGIKATAWHSKHGYFISFVVHLDNLLYGQDRIELPNVDDLDRVRNSFCTHVFAADWLDEVLLFPSFDDDPTRQRCFEILNNFYDRLKIQRIDPAVNLTGLTTDEVQAYAYVLNRGNWNYQRQHFNTIQNPAIPHPKTFISSCCLESLVKAKDGDKVTAVRINCYDKVAAFRDKLENPDKKHKPSPKKVEAAKGIFRVEVQCWQPCIEKLRDMHWIESRSIDDVMTVEFSKSMLVRYVTQFGGTGDYFKLSTAKRKIRASKKKIPSADLRKKLVKFLELLHATYKSNEDMLPLNEALPHVAKQMGVTEKTVSEYRQLLKTLNINPVTLPDNGAVDNFPNLLPLVLAQYPSAEQGEAPNSVSPAELNGTGEKKEVEEEMEEDDLPF